MKNMDDYFNELRISMKGATPKEATDKLIQEVNAEWGEQCKKSWLPEYTEEVLRFIKDAEERYHVKGFRITDPSVGHECMRDNMDCLKYLDVNLLTPEYLDTLLERSKYNVSKMLEDRSETDPELLEKAYTREYAEHLLDVDIHFYERLPECYRTDSVFAKRYFDSQLDSQKPDFLYCESYIKDHTEIAVSAMEQGVSYSKLSQSTQSLDPVIRYMLEHHPERYKDVPFDIKKDNKEYAVIAVKNRTANIEFVPTKLKEDKSFVLAAIEANPRCLYGMLDKYKSDPDICFPLIKNDSFSINMTGDTFRSGKNLYQAYKLNPQIVDRLGESDCKILANYSRKIGDIDFAISVERIHDIQNQKRQAIRLLENRCKANGETPDCDKIYDYVEELERQNESLYERGL